jgi:hypothetical protein
MIDLSNTKWEINNATGKIIDSIQSLENRVLALERELQEVHAFLNEIGIPQSDENGYRDYPHTPIGKRLKHLQKRQIEFYSVDKTREKYD